MILVLIFIALMGLVVGSFLNVVVLRLRAGKDFVRGRSACPSCKHELSPLELVPVFSWLALRGRCRHCKKPISIQYPLVELTTSILFVLAFLTQPTSSPGDIVRLLLWLYIIGSLVVLAVYDIRWYLLPDKVLLPIIVPACALLISYGFASGHVSSVLNPLGAALLFGGAFYSVAALSDGKWMGGGDIKLAFVMGLLLGLQKTALAMFIAFLSAAIIGGLLIVTKRKSRKDYIPFGPFLIGGTLVSYFVGNSIIAWYLQVSGLNLL